MTTPPAESVTGNPSPLGDAILATADALVRLKSAPTGDHRKSIATVQSVRSTLIQTAVLRDDRAAMDVVPEAELAPYIQAANEPLPARGDMVKSGRKTSLRHIGLAKAAADERDPGER
jgi:hypothetical protein